MVYFVLKYFKLKGFIFREIRLIKEWKIDVLLKLGFDESEIFSLFLLFCFEIYF